MYRSPAERPRARLPLLDQVTIKTPCRESWETMTGDDRTRFCTRCSKNVYDLWAMSEDEAETFLATHLDDEDACVRLYRRPDGRILTSECVQGTRTRHVRKVAVGIAAGLCAAFAGTVALANVHVPDGRNLPKVRARIDVKRLAAANFDDAANAIPAEEFSPALGSNGLMGNAVDDMRGFAMGGIGFVPPEPAPKPAARSPVIRESDLKVSGGLPTDVVRRTVRLNQGRTAACYESALSNNPTLVGSVGVQFLIGRDGSVVATQDASSDLPDPAVVACIVRGFSNLSFPVPEPEGVVSVSYRVSLRSRS